MLYNYEQNFILPCRHSSKSIFVTIVEREHAGCLVGVYDKLYRWVLLTGIVKYLSADWHFIRSYLLTPWSTVLLEKLTGLQLVKKFTAFYGTRRFITAFTSARHLSLSWASSIQSIPPHPTSWTSMLIVSSHLRYGLPSGLFPSSCFIQSY
jgi:hypothetical protein